MFLQEAVFVGAVSSVCNDGCVCTVGTVRFNDGRDVAGHRTARFDDDRTAAVSTRSGRCNSDNEPNIHS